MDSTHLPANQDEWRTRIRTHLLQSADLKRRTADERLDSIVSAANTIVDCYRSMNKVLICGNGGSAADSQHMAAEFMNRLSDQFERPGLPAIALTTDTSFITSYSNDIGFDRVFERQVLALGNAGDVLLTITTSGKSPNVVKAVEAARLRNMKTIALTGEGGSIIELVDCPITVPSSNTQFVQECFLSIEHAVCDVVEQMLFAS